jgi:DNA-binding FadR family transcriptional regulator
MEARIIIEENLAGLAAQRATAEEIAETFLAVPVDCASDIENESVTNVTR